MVRIPSPPPGPLAQYGLTRLPVTQEITGSNPVGVARRIAGVD